MVGCDTSKNSVKSQAQIPGSAASRSRIPQRTECASARSRSISPLIGPSVSPGIDIGLVLYRWEAMMSTHNDAHRGEHVLDESLSRLAVTGPEFGGGLSNHGAMGAEALVRLGRSDDVEPWLDGYIRELEEPPRATYRITDETWRDALGVPQRVTDWELYLRDQLAGEPWQTVLARWWPRLAP